MTDYESLRPFATQTELTYLEAIKEHGSQRAAAKALGRNHRSLERALESLKKRAISVGYSPEHGMVHPAPDGFKLQRLSTMHTTPEGKPQWVMLNRDAERQAELMREAVEAMSESIVKESPTSFLSESVNESLLNLYPITDLHMGMYAWGEQTGADWDVKIAETLLIDWFREAIARSPDSAVGVLGQIGDFLHFDGLDAVTPTSGHVLDADTRHQKMVRVTIRVLRRIINMLLAKHEHVHVIMAEGNHDLAGSSWLREMFHALYEDEPRLNVDTNPDPYYCYEFGKVSLFFHHGHKKKPNNVDDVFVSKFREIFGRTEFSYGHMGHLHHERSLETNLMIVEQHRTLASPDQYASSGGWMSGRSVPVITYHKDYGQVGRHDISPEMLK